MCVRSYRDSDPFFVLSARQKLENCVFVRLGGGSVHWQIHAFIAEHDDDDGDNDVWRSVPRPVRASVPAHRVCRHVCVCVVSLHTMVNESARARAHTRVYNTACIILFRCGLAVFMPCALLFVRFGCFLLVYYCMCAVVVVVLLAQLTGCERACVPATSSLYVGNSSR